MGLMTEQFLMAALQTENARLIASLEVHGIAWHLPADSVPTSVAQSPPPRLGNDENVARFRRLFRGRTDVYPIRWESKTTGN